MASLRTRLGRLLVLVCLAASPACSYDATTEDDVADVEEPLTRVSAEERTLAQREALDPAKFDRLTPTSAKIMKASRYWMRAQRSDARYPKARMCASNVSKVLFLAGLTSFDQAGVRALVSEVRSEGGRVFKMPQKAADFARALSAIDRGRLPAGTLVAGMNVRTSAPGDQHVGFVGHTDPDGTVWIYHNNWYRPENEGGARKPHMVSEENLRRGFPRQWMATPWIRIVRDREGKITDVKSLLPALDDMDPFNPKFQVTLAILPEVARELGQ